jgi:hypothetical protein
MAVRSKASVFRRLIAGIAVSNPAEGMDVCLVFVVCCVGRQAPATRLQKSYASTSRPPRPDMGCCTIRMLVHIITSDETFTLGM